MKNLKTYSVLTKLSVPILLSLGMFVVFVVLLIQLKSIDKTDKIKLGIASQNSLLIKEIAYYSELITKGKYEYSKDLNRSLSVFSKNIEVLEKGGTYSHLGKKEIVPSPNAKEKKIIFLLKEQWNNYYLNAHLLLETKNKNKTEFAIGVIEEIQQDLYKKNNNLYNEYYNQNASINIWLALITTGTMLLFIIMVVLILYYFKNNIYKPIVRITESAKMFVDGKNPEVIEIKDEDEIGLITDVFNSVVMTINNNKLFAQQIAKGHLDYRYIPNKNDNLGKALDDMRNDMLKMKNLDDKAKVQQEKEVWKNNGRAIFSKLLLKFSENRKEFADDFIQKLVKHTENITGAFYLFDNKELEQISKYAYNRNKFIEKGIDYNEGLLAEIIKEKKLKIFTDIPDNYMTITSGLGDIAPSYLIIIPIIFNDTVFGVIEMAGFKKMGDYKVEFLEGIITDLAFVISTTENTTETGDIKEMLKEQSEIIAEQNKIIYTHSIEIEELRQSVIEREKEIENLNYSIGERIVMNKN